MWSYWSGSLSTEILPTSLADRLFRRKKKWRYIISRRKKKSYSRVDLLEREKNRERERERGRERERESERERERERRTERGGREKQRVFDIVGANASQTTAASTKPLTLFPFFNIPPSSSFLRPRKSSPRASWHRLGRHRSPGTNFSWKSGEVILPRRPTPQVKPVLVMSPRGVRSMWDSLRESTSGYMPITQGFPFVRLPFRDWEPG